MFVRTGKNKVKKIKQKDIARVINVSEGFISQCLSGHKSMPKKYWPIIESKLGIPRSIWKRAA